MNALAIDTSSDNVSLSLMRKGKIIVDFNRRMARSSSRIIYYLKRHLKESIDMKKIDVFVVGAGPGSFTGLRISFSIIKGLSLALDKPVISIGSFFSPAYFFKKKKDKIAVITNAGRSLIYAASFKTANNKLKIETKEKLTTLKEFMPRKKDYFFITYNKKLREQVLDLYPQTEFCPYDSYPRAKHLLFIAGEFYNQGRFTSLERLKPLYLYPKTCQIRGK